MEIFHDLHGGYALETSGVPTNVWHLGHLFVIEWFLVVPAEAFFTGTSAV